MSEALKILLVVIPMGFDTFGLAVGLGLAGLPPERRLRIAALFAAFEAAMPLIGYAAGAPVASLIGGAASVFAGSVLIGLGVYVLAVEARSQAQEDEGSRVLDRTQRGIGGALLLGLSISLDEFAVGVSAGLIGLSVLAVALAAGAQAFVVTYVGLRLGTRLGAAWQEASERIAGAAFIALGVLLIALRGIV